MKANETQADLFQQLWAVLPHPAGTVVRMMSKAKDGAVNGDSARTWREMDNFARYWGARDQSVYVCPNPCRVGVGSVRHSAKDVTHWSYFLIDMDPVSEVYDAQAAIEEALLWFGEWLGRDFKRTPPLTIDSGRGRQAWIRIDDWKLAESMDEVHAHMEGRGPLVIGGRIARAVNGYWLKMLDERLGLVHGCRIDTSVADLCRPMRCPGTVNRKTGRQANFIVRTDQIFGGLAALMTTGTPKEVTAAPPEVVSRPGLSWQKAFSSLTLTAQTYLLDGHEEPGRHKTMFHTAKKLQEVGCTRDSVRRAITRANGLRGEGSALDQKDIEHALDTAFKGGS